MKIKTIQRTILSDLYTPVGLFLKLRDHYSSIIMLESSDYSNKEGNYSYLAFEDLAFFEVKDGSQRLSFYGKEEKLSAETDLVASVNGFISSFQMEGENSEHNGVFGYTAFNAIRYFEKNLYQTRNEGYGIPDVYYVFYRYILVFDHFRNTLICLENIPEGGPESLQKVIDVLSREDHPAYSFECNGEASSNLTDEDFLNMVDRCIQHCQLGDVFQVVPSRRFSYNYSGDDFQVYRRLRSINPSPYLFYFDFGDFRLFGSSPEAQVIVEKGMAEVHPIAGTIKRTMDEAKDQKNINKLLADPKENAEHIMLVDLARNDLSKSCLDVTVASFREIQKFSHVIHLVSRVVGKIKEGISAYQVFADTFPQGTLSGAPKVKAIDIIQSMEPHQRGFYGGAIGKMGFDHSLNHAIIIRSFLSKGNQLHMQAGAGIVIDSVPQNEMLEVNNKLKALAQSILIK
ncbi:MAG TPA: anthranilate synthase component I family protein [Saprospiraceae bacterium]|nr:anthranilate synthase component I family protein [Saprospiraceae bacterium]